MKTCEHCGTEFESRRPARFCGNRCYRAANAERSRSLRRQWYVENREKALAYAKVYEEQNREVIACRRRANRESNQSRIAEYMRAYRAENRERLKAQRQLYLDSHPGLRNEWDRSRYRAKSKGEAPLRVLHVAQQLKQEQQE